MSIVPVSAPANLLVTASAPQESLSTSELPSLLKRWMTLNEEVNVLNAEIKQRRTTAKAVKDMVLRIMEANRIATLNVSKGSVVHRVREVRKGFTPDFLSKQCKEFFEGDEEKAKELMEFLEENRQVTTRHELKLMTDTGSTRSSR
jgi:LPS O-antigen subunit length determinant protein (WzzB/FepE family)